MKRQIVELTGIVRNLPDDTVKDGTMQELLNLRVKDGALRPVGTKVQIGSWYDRKIKYIHQISNTIKCFIGSDGFFVKYWLYVDDELSGEGITTDIQATDNMNYASWRNVLLVADRANEVMSMMIFDEKDLVYRTFNGFDGQSLLPDLPTVNFQREADSGGDDTREFNATLDTLEQAQQSQWMKMLNDKSDAGYFCGCLLFRAAWQLVDGSIVKQSIPDKIYASEISTTAITSSPYTVTTTFTAYKVKFMIVCDADWLAEVKDKYKDVVKSLVIYCTAPRAPELEVKTVKAGQSPKDDRRGSASTIVRGGANRTYDVEYLSEYIPNIEEELYYFVKSFDLASLQANTWIELKVESLLDLNTRSQMPINNLSHHTLYGASMYVYNDRIWLGNVKNYLFRHSMIDGMVQPCDGYVTGDNYKVGFEFVIAISNTKIVNVWSGWSSNVNYYDDDGKITFKIRHQEISSGSARRAVVRNDNSYFGYPDARAKKVKIFIQVAGNDYLAGEYNLTSIASQNFSYHEGVIINDYLYNFSAGEINYGNKNYYDDDRIQASELSNPFVWPPINSYRVTGKVLGMASNAVALSSGQFGQHPLLVFTNQGIWAMTIGGGEVLISSIVPMSREVCNNSESITPVDGGTVFTTEKGLMLISGSQVNEIGKLAEGPYNINLSDIQKRKLARYCVDGGVFGPSYIPPEAEYTWDDENKLLTFTVNGQTGYYIWDEKTNLWYNVTLTPFDTACTEEFKDYLSSAKIAFDYVNKELVVSKPDALYSWVYNLESKSWHKIMQNWNVLHSIYPKAYGIKWSGGPDETKQFGLLYNWYAIVDPRNIAAEGWHVMTYAELQDLVNAVGGIYTAGKVLKDSSNLYWAPITQGTNDFKFNARGAGWRMSEFTGKLYYTNIASVTEFDAYSYYGLSISFTDNVSFSGMPKHAGSSVRLVKDSSDISHGETRTYIGNDGKHYTTIGIYGREYLAENLCETRYRDGSIIPEVTDQNAWNALATGAWCCYNNDLSQLGRWAPIIERLDDLNSESYSSQILSMFATRPMKLTSAEIKTISRLLLKATIDQVYVQPVMLALMGSQDKINWRQLEVLSVPYTDAPTARFILHRQHNSYRYYMLIFAGKLGENSAITHLIADLEEKYSDKLR